MINCLNCHTTYEGNFCPHCGQGKKVNRVSWYDHFHDLQHFLHLDNELFYTSGQLLRKPSSVISGYLEGRRRRHYGPLSTVLVIAGIYGLIFYLSKLQPFNLQIQVIYIFHELINKEYLKLPGWILENYAFLELIIFIPIFSLASFLAYFNSNKSFAEHFTMSAFQASLRLLVGIITFPILWGFADSSYIVIPELLINLLELGLTFLVYTRVVKPKYSRLEGFLRTVLLFLLVGLELFLITWIF